LSPRNFLPFVGVFFIFWPFIWLLYTAWPLLVIPFVVVLAGMGYWLLRSLAPRPSIAVVRWPWTGAAGSLGTDESEEELCTLLRAAGVDVTPEEIAEWTADDFDQAWAYAHSIRFLRSEDRPAIPIPRCLWRSSTWNG
jgi:hypothetical protein